jgi:hypothetical protein
MLAGGSMEEEIMPENKIVFGFIVAVVATSASGCCSSSKLDVKATSRVEDDTLIVSVHSKPFVDVHIRDKSYKHSKTDSTDDEGNVDFKFPLGAEKVDKIEFNVDVYSYARFSKGQGTTSIVAAIPERAYMNVLSCSKKGATIDVHAGKIAKRFTCGVDNNAQVAIDIEGSVGQVITAGTSKATVGSNGKATINVSLQDWLLGIPLKGVARNLRTSIRDKLDFPSTKDAVFPDHIMKISAEFKGKKTEEEFKFHASSYGLEKLAVQVVHAVATSGNLPPNPSSKNGGVFGHIGYGTRNELFHWGDGAKLSDMRWFAGADIANKTPMRACGPYRGSPPMVPQNRLDTKVTVLDRSNGKKIERLITGGKGRCPYSIPGKTTVINNFVFDYDIGSWLKTLR